MIVSEVPQHSFLINRYEGIEAHSPSTRARALLFLPLTVNTREMRSIDVAIMNFPPSSFRNSISTIGWEIAGEAGRERDGEVCSVC